MIVLKISTERSDCLVRVTPLLIFGESTLDALDVVSNALSPRNGFVVLRRPVGVIRFILNPAITPVNTVRIRHTAPLIRLFPSSPVLLEIPFNASVICIKLYVFLLDVRLKKSRLQQPVRRLQVLGRILWRRRDASLLVGDPVVVRCAADYGS